MSWRLKEPFSIRARQQGSLLQFLARAFRLWSMRLSQAAKPANEEFATYPLFNSDAAPGSEVHSLAAIGPAQ